MKLVFLGGAVWLAFMIVRHFTNTYAPDFGPEFAIGVMVMAGVGDYLFKDIK